MKSLLTLSIAWSTLCLALFDRPVTAQQDGEWGTVQGSVVFKGPIPAAKNVAVNKDEGHCLQKGPIPDESWVINPKNQGIRWTVVWLEPEKGASPLKIHPSLAKPKEDKVFIDQPCCKFEPRVLAMQEGQILVVKNSAPVAHNVNYTSIRNPSNNVLVPAGGEHQIPPLKADRLPMSIKCDIHGWMRGYVRIYNHPYFAITDADGKFEIKNAPAGKYRLVSWQETAGWGQGGREGVEVTIKGGGTIDMKLELKEVK